MNTGQAWHEITTIRDLTSYSKFERGFRDLQAISEQRTRMKLRFSRTLLRTVFQTFTAAAFADLRHEGRRDGLSRLPVQLPYVLAGTLLRAFDQRFFDKSEDCDPTRVNVARATVTTEEYFLLAFCVEYYLFLTYKRLGYDYLPRFDPQDVALVEHILDYIDFCPANSRPQLSYKIIFRSISKKLAFDGF